MNTQQLELKERFSRAYDWFIPEKGSTSSENNQLRTDRMVVIIAISAMVAWTVSYFFFTFLDKNALAATISLIAFLSVASLLLFIKITGAYRTAVTLELISIFVTTFFMILATGGLDSPIMIWLLITPLLTMLLLDLRQSLVTILLIMLIIVAVFWLQSRDLLLHPAPLVAKNIQLSKLINDVEVAVFISFVGSIYKIARTRFYKKLDQTMLQLRVANEELRIANEKAKAATKAKSAFLANMSHEIRTPLNTIIGMTSLLLDTPQTAEQQEFTQMVRGSGDALLALINDILDFSKIEAGKLELEEQPFNLHQCVEEAADMLASKAQQKGLELIVHLDKSVPPLVEGDITRLRQVLINLLTNAIKFTHKGEVVVRVETAVSPHPFPQLIFSVKDTGIGIAAEGVGQLFQSFSQMDASTTRQYGGTGLGLAISKQLVTLMGGQIWVESTEGEGSNFQFSVALKPLATEPDPEECPLQGKHLLVVDDNATSGWALAEMGRRWGLAVATAVSAPQALAMLQENQDFAAILIDLQMPEVDGLALTEALKTNNALAAIPVVLMTPLNWQRQDPRSDYLAYALPKPIKHSQLRGVLAAVLHQECATAQPTQSLYAADSTLGERHPLRILVAEDNAINQKVVTVMLERLGYLADLAGNGLEVLEALQRQAYDLILMDVQMPEMDGVQTTRAIAALNLAERPYIIAVTASALQGDRERCLQAGMNDYVSKPIHMPELIAAIKRCPGLTNVAQP